VVLAVAVALAACDGGETATTVPGTTTTIDPEVRCAQLTQDATALLSDAVGILEGISPSQLADRELWPNELVTLEQRGEELESTIVEAGCDVLEIQAAVVEAAAGLEAEGYVARLYLDQLLQIGS
jgi:hypothetical protein